MVHNLTIKNFKSIKDLRLECKRVNVFIGDPNSGKSNILEGLGFLNYCDSRVNSDLPVGLKDFVRFEQVSQLFFDFDSSLISEIVADSFHTKARIEEDEYRIESFLGLNSTFLIKLKLNGQFSSSSTSNGVKSIPKVRSYKFDQERIAKHERREGMHLEAPFGGNIESVILLNKELREQIQSLISGLGYKILYRRYEENFEIYREMEGFSISFPLSVISDTVRRMIFYLTAIESNQDNTVVLEEPESNTFPLYIKYLGERIASYSTNQFFVTTHNPYFLQTIIEKTPEAELNVILVEMKDYATQTTTLKQRNVEEILGLNSDIFLNLEKVKNP